MFFIIHWRVVNADLKTLTFLVYCLQENVPLPESAFCLQTKLLHALMPQDFLQQCFFFFPEGPLLPTCRSDLRLNSQALTSLCCSFERQMFCVPTAEWPEKYWVSSAWMHRNFLIFIFKHLLCELYLSVDCVVPPHQRGRRKEQGILLY